MLGDFNTDITVNSTYNNNLNDDDYDVGLQISDYLLLPESSFAYVNEA